MVLKYKKLWLSIGYGLVALIIQQTLTASPAGISYNFSDKFLHVFGYFVLMGWFVQIYQAPVMRMVLALLFIAMGIALEYLQGLSGIRQYEVNDMIANGLGVVIAWTVAFTPFSKILQYVDVFIQGKFKKI